MKHDFLLPKENIVDEQMTIIQWLVKDRDFVEQGTEILEVETSKTLLNLVSEEPGFILLKAKEGETVSVGSVLASFYPDLPALEEDIGKVDVQGNETTNSKLTLESDEISSSANIESAQFSKAARDYIKDNNIDPGLFKGQGMVTTRVMNEILKKKGMKSESKTRDSTISDDQPENKIFNLKSEKVSASKKLEINLLTSGQAGNVNSSLTVQFHSEKIRETINEMGTFNGQIFVLILFELSRLLEEFPKLTSFYENEHIYYYDKVNIGVAMDMEKGLKVIVVKNANLLSPDKLAEELTNKGIDYLEDRLTIDNLSEGTITVSDLSNDGIIYFQPLINKRQSVIFGIGGDSNLEGYPMTLTIVFDHRVLTGREVSIFLNKMKSRLLSYAQGASD